MIEITNVILASRINIASLVRNKDVRKFLDGVYVSDKVRRAKRKKKN